MEWWMAILLGILQGITEWLPISSSGHLAIFQYYFNEKPPILFDVILHLGSLSVISYILRSEIKEFLEALPGTLRKISNPNTFNNEEKLVFLVILATIPTAVIGLMFDGEIIDSFNENMNLVGLCLIFTGVLIWYSKDYNDKLEIQDLPSSRSIYTGIIQGLAILPGVSRSGVTISILRIFGLNPLRAAKFSFLIFIPAILGATLLQLNEASSTLEEVGVSSILLGFLASSISSFLSIKFLIRLIDKQQFHYFTPYCFLLGIFLIYESLI
ncbi:MAG: hypothetical protein CL982_03885 [Euryarchaeota archaeon]|jgi:undecaprenyl-diphosphatase|nr:hypothetical protein [Euryarchaeota archaeon]|tara:strand:- start:1857 stop:2666 length:810 start_codon:yes stop_codon:yes gene_type:complete